MASPGELSSFSPVCPQGGAAAHSILPVRPKYRGSVWPINQGAESPDGFVIRGVIDLVSWLMDHPPPQLFMDLNWNLNCQFGILVSLLRKLNDFCSCTNWCQLAGQAIRSPPHQSQEPLCKPSSISQSNPRLSQSHQSYCSL